MSSSGGGAHLSKDSARLSSAGGGGGRIRTCEPLRASGFQDRRLQPLGHSSGGVITARYPVALGSVEAQRKQSVSGEPVSDDERAYAGGARLATFTRHR